ncbi:hypothetical protein [Pseudoalteromonas galatheae]|uniref:hypothetical protein n=1 Tax=Pseudoalteromonas galatheae TaxID=579562 RepID=UPI0030D2A160
MSTYSQRVADNILPFSVSCTLPEAFKEWYFTDNIEDHVIANEECELCNQEQLRYHFEIKNRHTNHHLWVGSSCILRFKVQVFENGTLLNVEDASKKLDKLKKKMRQDSCVNSLKKLASQESNSILANALEFYLKNKYLTPRQAFVVFWRLSTNKVDHCPSFFKVSLKKDKYKNDLREMPLERVHMIWPALSSSQRKLARKYGHTTPESK